MQLKFYLIKIQGDKQKTILFPKSETHATSQLLPANETPINPKHNKWTI